ncbi:uncharacterized protein LOC129710305 [Leucoraja erinacea]|uniref:uncharacterized protein LOC129710305 n=1 Tax=Leucoraja erinaceus TaxID=7782 RepID=UPI0024553231|nr:uncharacterized protein LOC129710305 [Leucoraja erinacea]XP_055513182.1 uncharacterized protein LOC129710305 [Leucoraja erinacea]XP_055513184.1 uncharacterized protein LOC129710305 [Leucoraja erinacea]
MAERSAAKSASQEETSSRTSSWPRSSKKGRHQNTMQRRSSSNQIASQKRGTGRNQGTYNQKLQDDARARQTIERDNICLLERIARVMNPPGGALVSSAYSLRRTTKCDREEMKLKKQQREYERLHIENENLAMLEKLATIMAPQPGGPSWNDYKKSKWSGKPAQDKLPLISQEPRSVMSRKQIPKEQKAKNFAEIEAENINILEKLATIMAPKPGGSTWGNYDLKSLSTPKYVSKMPKISASKGAISQTNNRTKEIKLKEVPVGRNSIEVANLVMLERLAKIMAPPPGGLSWKDFEKKKHESNQGSTEFPKISKNKGGMRGQRYSTKDQNESWRDINQKLPPVSSNRKKTSN